MPVISDINRAVEALREAVEQARRICLFTGAGISTESGIPDFRSPGGIWSRMRPITYQEFVASEAARLEDWKRRFAMMEQFAAAEPNAGHRAITALVRSGRSPAVITQNIDGLHQRTGTPEDCIIELHGTAAYATCLDCCQRYELETCRRMIEETRAAPRCTACGGLVKAAVISFGQAMPEEAMARAEREARACDLFLAIGSSLVVHPAAMLPEIAVTSGARLAILNGEATPLDVRADLVLRGPIGAILGPLGEAALPH